MEEKMQIVYSYYVLDIIHKGHLLMMKNSKALSGKDGKLITESLKDYTRKNVLEEYDSLDSFLRSWKGAEKKD